MQAVSSFEAIRTAEAYESPTNPRTGKHAGPEFEDLKTSIAEQGMLVPVIARRKPKGKHQFEVIAGARRLAAATALKLETIPARIVEADDQQVREIQIIENLQRQDVHPIDEGEAFRELHEQNKLDIKSIAARVGKSESYVRGRLFLTNLQGPPRSAYRKGEMPDTHAQLIARLNPDQQTATFKWMRDEWEQPTAEELRRHIENEYDEPLKNQPWLHDAAMAQAVGPCTSCPPNKSTLFGDRKEGECTDLKCWGKKMDRAIDYLKTKYPNALQVSTRYGTDDKKILGSGNYEKLGKKKCASATKGIVAEGPDRGKVLDICADPKCKTHGTDFTPYEKTPEEKERRKKEREKQKRLKELQNKKLEKALATITWPLKTDAHLEALLKLAAQNAGANAHRSICKRRGIEVKKETTRGYSHYDYEGALQKAAAEMTAEQKAQLAFELLTDTGYDSHRTGIEKLTKNK